MAKTRVFQIPEAPIRAVYVKKWCNARLLLADGRELIFPKCRKGMVIPVRCVSASPRSRLLAIGE